MKNKLISVFNCGVINKEPLRVWQASFRADTEGDKSLILKTIESYTDRGFFVQITDVEKT